MPWNQRNFYKNIRHGIFINADVPTNKKSHRQRVVLIQNRKKAAVKKVLNLISPNATNANFNKRLLNCRQMGTLGKVASLHRCSSFICPFCFYRRLYVFFRGRLHAAVVAQKTKYICVTRTQTMMLRPYEEPGLLGTYLFDPLFIPPIQTRADAEQIAARLFTDAESNKRYEQTWFENDAINCQVVEPAGGFSTTWFDYQPDKNLFSTHRLSLHLTNTNALSPPTTQALNTRVNFSWHLLADFDPCFVFDNFISFPYGLYSALLQPSRTEFSPAHVVAYMFGMRRLLQRKFKFQQTWGCLRGRTSTA